MTIYKYTIDSSTEYISMPKNAKILDIQYQKSILTLWALVNPDNKQELRVFKIYGTGWDITNLESLNYLKTVQDMNNLVWHVFEVIN